MNVNRLPLFLIVSICLFLRFADAKESPIDFSGSFSDPNHPGCVRNIFIFDLDTVWIEGNDGNPGCSKDTIVTQFTVTAKISGNEIIADFSNKGGPANLKGVYTVEYLFATITWEDGNKWTRLSPENQDEVEKSKKYTKKTPAEYFVDGRIPMDNDEKKNDH